MWPQCKKSSIVPVNRDQSAAVPPLQFTCFQNEAALTRLRSFCAQTSIRTVVERHKSNTICVAFKPQTQTQLHLLVPVRAAFHTYPVRLSQVDYVPPIHLSTAVLNAGEQSKKKKKKNMHAVPAALKKTFTTQCPALFVVGDNHCKREAKRPLIFTRQPGEYL